MQTEDGDHALGPSVAPAGPQPRCAAHESEVAVAGCARCGNYLCAVCAIPAEAPRAFYCRACKVRLEEAGVLGRVPWEQRGGSFVARYWKTVGRVLSAPTAFFSAMPSQGYLPAIGFLYNTMLYACVLSFLSSWLTLEALPNLTQTLKDQLLGNVAVALVGASIVTPILAFVSCGWVHLHVLLFGGKRGFEATYRAMAYLSSTYFVLSALQFASLGLRETSAVAIIGLVMAVFVLSWMTMALVHAHHMPTWASALAVAMLAGEAVAVWWLLVAPALRSSQRAGFG